MRDYEVVYIFNSQLEEEEVESKLDSHHEQITGEGSGEVTAVEDWGKRQLAYPIEDHENGHYVVAQFTVEPERLDEFERVLKLDGDLLRYLVVLHEDELPTPPSARRPGAGPEEEDEEGEEAGPDEEEAGSDEDADEDEAGGGEDEESDAETTDREESDGKEEEAEGEASEDEEPEEEEPEEEESEDEEPEEEESAEEESEDEASDAEESADEESDEEDEEKE